MRVRRLVVPAQIWKGARPKTEPDGANAHGSHDPLVTPHANFLSLGRAEYRQSAYRDGSGKPSRMPNRRPYVCTCSVSMR